LTLKIQYQMETGHFDELLFQTKKYGSAEELSNSETARYLY